MSPDPYELTQLGERLAALELRENSTGTGLGWRDLEAVQNQSAAELEREGEALAERLARLEKRLAVQERAKRPNISQHVAAAVEPLVDSLVNLEARHDGDITALKSAAATAAADAARAAQVGAALSAQAVTGWASQFAFGE